MSLLILAFMFRQAVVLGGSAGRQCGRKCWRDEVAQVDSVVSAVQRIPQPSSHPIHCPSSVLAGLQLMTRC